MRFEAAAAHPAVLNVYHGFTFEDGPAVPEPGMRLRLFRFELPTQVFNPRAVGAEVAVAEA